MDLLLGALQTIAQLLSAGIAITAFSLWLYALSFNLRDRVARTFAIILVCVVIVFVGETFASVATPEWMEIWMRVQWVGLVYLPSAYLHFSDALLATTGRPSRGRRRALVRVFYAISTLFLILIPTHYLVGPLAMDGKPVPHLERTTLTWVFAGFYSVGMVWSWVNFWRAYQRTVTSTSRRRMAYLITGALAPALGSYPYLLFGSRFAAEFPLVFWMAALLSNILVSALMILMAYAVAFFGVSWPDRVVKRRLFKWIMRGPVTASTVLAVTTITGRVVKNLGSVYAALTPVVMVATLLLMEYLITILAPYWERALFYGRDRSTLKLVQNLEERLLTVTDLKQFLEALLTAICDRMQVSSAFIMAVEPKGSEFIINVGRAEVLDNVNISGALIDEITVNGSGFRKDDVATEMYSWGDYHLVPLFKEAEDGNKLLLGLLGLEKHQGDYDIEQVHALSMLVERATMALDDWYRQQQVFASLEALNPQVEVIQRLRAASRYDGSELLADIESKVEDGSFSKWVKDALAHYWGGPKLTKSPLLKLEVVRQAMAEEGEVSANALRSILRKAIERIKPEGERRFTTEWILYNILEMKFLEGRKVREVAMRLAVSEADLYRKQRVAIDAVANAILEMEKEARIEAGSTQGQLDENQLETSRD